MSQEATPLSRTVVVIIIITFFVILFFTLTAYTKYIFAKDYTFIIETPCSTENGVCYVRDCEEYCPPNKLEIYSVFYMPAYMYKECTGNSCENICFTAETSHYCTEIICDKENGDDCIY